MKHIGDSMPNFTSFAPKRSDDDQEKCAICGTVVKFFRNEYKKPCKTCGTWIFERRKAINRQQKECECWLCMDTGIVEYPVQKERGIYKYVARCSCPKGIDKDKENIPFLDQCDAAPKPEYIELRNQRKYGKAWRA